MESTASIGFFIAFSAGVLSFLSPCVLPLIPSYLSFITGMSLEEMGDHRRAAVTHALLFVSGFTLIFLMLGATATGLGRLVQFQQVWLERIGGVLIIFFGLYLLGVFRWGALLRERRVHIQNKPLGYLGSVLVGVAFGGGVDAVHRSDPGRHPHVRRHAGERGAGNGTLALFFPRPSRAVSRSGPRRRALYHLVPEIPEVHATSHQGVGRNPRLPRPAPPLWILQLASVVPPGPDAGLLAGADLGILDSRIEILECRFLWASPVWWTPS